MKSYISSIVVPLIVASVAGCTTKSFHYRAEQIEQIGAAIWVVVGSGVTARSTEGGRRTFEKRRYHILVFDAEAPACPPVRPSRILDGSVGLGAIDLERPLPGYYEPQENTTGPRVDFLMGAHADRVVRVISQTLHGRQRASVAVLGPDPRTGRWGVLAGGALDGNGDTYGASHDGAFAVFGSPPRVLDTRTLRYVPDGTLVGRIADESRVALAWRDWQVRQNEASLGDAGELGPIQSGDAGAGFCAWDIARHRVQWDLPRPPCDGLVVLVRTKEGDAVPRVLDIRPAIGGRTNDR